MNIVNLYYAKNEYHCSIQITMTESYCFVEIYECVFELSSEEFIEYLLFLFSKRREKEFVLLMQGKIDDLFKKEQRLVVEPICDVILEKLLQKGFKYETNNIHQLINHIIAFFFIKLSNNKDLFVKYLNNIL